ncbi:MAG: 50S ribosomal protein L29 [Candidatus Dormibacterales bacterium]
MKVDDLRILEVDELGVRLKTARRELYELRFKHAVGQLENKTQISKVRHDIARIMTVIRERDLGIVIVAHEPVADAALAPALAPIVPSEAADAVVEEEAAKPKRGRKKAEDKS